MIELRDWRVPVGRRAYSNLLEPREKRAQVGANRQPSLQRTKEIDFSSCLNAFFVSLAASRLLVAPVKNRDPTGGAVRDARQRAITSADQGNNASSVLQLETSNHGSPIRSAYTHTRAPGARFITDDLPRYIYNCPKKTLTAAKFTCCFSRRNSAV